MTSGKQTRQSQRQQNDELALRWAGPFGYAVLECLRRGEDFSEADFLGYAKRAPTVTQEVVQDGVKVQERSYGSTGHEVTMTLEGATVVPDFVGDPPMVSTAAPTMPVEPPPPPGYYKRVTTAGRPGEYPSPTGRRDQSGRVVRPVR